MKQFTLKLACLLGLLLSWGGDSWAQTLTQVTSLDDINEKDTYVLKYNGVYWNYKTPCFIYVDNTSLTCTTSEPTGSDFYFTFEKGDDGYAIKSVSGSKYLTHQNYSTPILGDTKSSIWNILYDSASKKFMLYFINTSGYRRYLYAVAESKQLGTASGGKTTASISTSYYTIELYKVTLVETVNVTIDYYNEDGTPIVSKAHTTNKGKGTLSSLLETIPSYITPEYYDVTGGSETTADPSAKIEQNSKFKVVTKYNSEFKYPTSNTEYFTLQSLYTDGNNYYLGTSTGITTPAYSNRRSIALRIDGDWYNGYSILDYTGNKLYLNGYQVSFSSSQDYKWKINNNDLFVDESGNFLQVKDSYFTTTTNSTYAAKLASTEAAATILNNNSEYVGQYDKSQMGSISLTFDDLVKSDNALDLTNGSYYFIENASATGTLYANPTTDGETTNAGDLDMSPTQNFSGLWKYQDGYFVHANSNLKLTTNALDETGTTWSKTPTGTDCAYTLNNGFRDLKVNENNTWKFRIAKSVTLNLTAKNGKSYATTCAPVDVTLSKDDAVNTTLYIEKSHTESSLSVVKAEAVAANTGIYVMNTEGATSATLLLANSGEASQANDAILKGTTITQDISSADHSLLRTLGFIKIDEKDQIGFFKPASTIKAIPANRAYLRLSNISQTNAFYIDFDGTTTSIDELLPATEAQDNAPIYDLSGRRMQGTLHKGIYIQNGRKFMVK